MNKRAYSLFTIVVLLLSACSNGNDIEEVEKTEEAPDTIHEVREEQEVVAELPKEELQEPKYTLDANWSLKPIGDADALKGIVEGLRAKGYGFIYPQTIKGVEHK